MVASCPASNDEQIEESKGGQKSEDTSREKIGTIKKS